MTPETSGAFALGKALGDAGVPIAFGVPGSQNVGLVEGLRRARVRLVTPTSELSAAFMANGYARVTRRAAVLTTIPGPGFVFALPGIAEARLDAVPLVWLCVAPPRSPDGREMLQTLPQARIAEGVVKAALGIGPGDDPGEVLQQAVQAAESGEPGPVLLQVAPEWLASRVPRPRDRGAYLRGAPPDRAPGVDRGRLDEAVARLDAAERPILLLGQGALDAVAGVRALVDRLDCPVLQTTSARGVVPEDDPRCLVADGPSAPVEALNDRLNASDLVVALGCGLTHNGTHGFRLGLRPDATLHVNSRPGSVAGPYAGGFELQADVRAFVGAALDGCAAREGGRVGPSAALPPSDDESEPRFVGVEDGARGFFRALRSALPREGLLVTDSGRHQMLARRHFRVWSPGGLMVPSDLQSMGFGLPAAIGAALAAPQRPVVALIGDGGLQMSAMELLVARREGVRVGAIVFRDEELSLIAEQQRREHGRGHATHLTNPDFAALAAALGALHVVLDDDVDEALRVAVGGREQALVEVRLGRSAGSRSGQARALARESLRTTVGGKRARWLRDLLRRVR